MKWISNLILFFLSGGSYFLYHQEHKKRLEAEAKLARLNQKLEHIQTQLKRQEASQKVKKILSTDAVIELDINQRIVDVNDAARSIFGPPAPDDTLMSWVKYHKLVKIATQALDTKLDIIHQLEYKTHIFQVKTSAVQYNDTPIGIILFLKDVSELQRLGRARRDFVANISHDLRTPITGIRLVAETLLGGALEDPQMAQQLTQTIVDETETLAQINQELMDLSLIESGRVPLKLVSLNLTKRVKKVTKHLKDRARRKNINLVIKIPNKISVLADKGMLTRILINLIHNALKFTEQGQVIVNASYKSKKEMVCVVVSDTGIGIDEKEQDRIFERFYKSDHARSTTIEEIGKTVKTGTGLGLAIVKHIVEAHGGRIWVESTLGQGATFYFTLPAGDKK